MCWTKTSRNSRMQKSRREPKTSPTSTWITARRSWTSSSSRRPRAAPPASTAICAHTLLCTTLTHTRRHARRAAAPDQKLTSCGGDCACPALQILLLPQSAPFVDAKTMEHTIIGQHCAMPCTLAQCFSLRDRGISLSLARNACPWILSTASTLSITGTLHFMLFM